MGIVDLTNPIYITTFLLLFVRMSGLFVFMPIFNYAAVPMTVKVMISIFFTFLFFPITPLVKFDINITNLILAVISEATFSFFTGMAAYFIFAIIQFAGDMIAMAMGFQMASIIDPNSGQNNSVISQLLNLIALLVFLGFNGHHYIILFIAKSIQDFPLGSFVDMNSIYHYFVLAGKNMFLIALTIAFPIFVLNLFVDILFALIMKTVPQFNLMAIGFPVKIFLTFFALVILIPSMMMIFQKQTFEMFKFLQSIF